MPKPVGIYARYSSDLQNPRSIDDQIAICGKLLEAGEFVYRVYSDAAVSGTRIDTRKGMQTLLSDVRAKRVSVILSEGIDRLSRDVSDISNIQKLAQFNDCEIRTLIEGGRVNALHVGFKGTMNALYLEDHVRRTKRGHAGNVQRGKAAGGLSYGYRKRMFNDVGEVEAGLREIDVEQAKIIVEIFERFVGGEQMTTIANDFNRRGVRTARGGMWSGGTLRGPIDRPTGILRNEQYTGKLIYNRMSYPRDPETGRRIGRVNPRDEWEINEVPALRIISDELWYAAQEILNGMVAHYQLSGRRYKSGQFTISNKGYCHCGSALRKKSGKYFICPRAKRGDGCDDRRAYRDDFLLGMLVSKVAAWSEGELRDYACLIRREADKTQAMIRDLSAEQACAEAALNRLYDAIEDGVIIDGTFRERVSKQQTIFKNAQAQIKLLRAEQIEKPVEVSNLSKLVVHARSVLSESIDVLDDFVNVWIEQFSVAHEADGTVLMLDIRPDFRRISCEYGV